MLRKILITCLLPIAVIAQEVTYDNSVLAPGWTSLTFTPPSPSSYTLASFSPAKDGPVINQREEKIKLQQLIFEQQNKEMEAITSRWQADSMSDSWLSKNVRPLVLVWCIVIFSVAGLLDSVDSIPFHIGETWNDTFEKVMMSVVLAYFGGRTTEKATSLFKK